MFLLFSSCLYIFVISFCEDGKLRVSVVVPVYNVKKYLIRCLDSVIEQTLKDIEIICVDDGSDDGSELILKYYDEKGLIKLLTQTNLGVSAARNLGIKNAKADFVAFVDADDYIEPDFLEKLYNAAIKFDADIACGSIIRENEKEGIELLAYNDFCIAETIRDKFILAGVPQSNYVWNKIYRKEKIISEQIFFLEGTVYEDYLFTSQILEKLGRLVSVPNVSYHYYKHSASLIKNNSDKNRADKLAAHSSLVEKCLRHNIYLENDVLISKEEILFLGLKFLKIYNYRASKVVYLFGAFPILEIKKYI